MKQIEFNHVMIDIETLAQCSGAVITSIGAVRFDIKSGKRGYYHFYENVNIDSCLDAGMKVEGGTIRWWMTNSDEARREIAKIGKPIKEVLEKLACFLTPTDILWSNGLRFDIAKIEEAYRINNMKVPWDFHNERDVRTLVSFAPEIKEEVTKGYKDSTIAHQPIYDCNIQIDYCSKIWQKLFP